MIKKIANKLLYQITKTRDRENKNKKKKHNQNEKRRIDLLLLIYNTQSIFILTRQQNEKNHTNSKQKGINK